MSSASDYRFVRFRPAHFDLLELQPSQAYLREHYGEAELIKRAEGPAYTVFAGEKAILCGGMREYGADRGVLWSFVDRSAGAHFTAIHRFALRFLDVFDRRYLQATCRTGFDAGARWLSMLGFTWSRSLGPFGPGGVPHDLFERVH